MIEHDVKERKILSAKENATMEGIIKIDTCPKNKKIGKYLTPK